MSRCSLNVVLLLVAAGALALAVPAPAPGPAAAAAGPPVLLGVWYGTYDAGTDATAEVWLGIYFQLAQDGWDARGHVRWHEDAAEVLGAGSLGKAAEYFDTITGSIARVDPRAVTLAEDRHGGRLSLTLTEDDVLEGVYHGAGAPDGGRKLRLVRIDTGYHPADVHRMGIDVSHHSGRVDWTAVRDAGYRFAYVKCSEGVDNPDTAFGGHWRALRALDLPRGAYHFYVTEDDPRAQARFFASRLQGDAGTLPPVVDIEVVGHGTRGDMTDTLRVFLREFETLTGTRPMLYTGPSFWDSHLRPVFGEYPLWLAEYGVVMPKVPFGWTGWLLWQTAKDQVVPGVEKVADVSLLHPMADLEAPAAGR